MISKIKRIIKILFSKIDENDVDKQRTRVVVRSSAISLVAKLGTILLGIGSMPIVYNCLDKYQFGVYATLTSIISWVDLFDFGIASGLRNRLAEANIDGDIKRAKKYISTSYCLLSCIAASLFIIYCLFIKHINWQAILNAADLAREDLDIMAFYVLLFFLIRFAASIINNIYYAFQKSFMVDVTQFIGKAVYLICLVVLMKINSLTLFKVAVIQSGISALVPIIAAVYFFLFVKREFSPSLGFIDFKISGDILGLGWQFFIIQMSLLVIHSGNNLLISQFVDPASVPAYSLSYQLFSYALIAYTIIITPLWSAYTEAWRMRRTDWIRSTMKKIKSVYFMFAAVCLLVVATSPKIFKIWIGEKAEVPVIMSFAVAVMVLLDMWIRIYDYFINGVGKIRVQMILSVIMAVVNIPLAYLFSVVLDFGAIGVVIASIISYGMSAIISPIQANRILNNKATGVWNK
jgi:O-antigen/teichoic acid export membrane protein